MTPEAFEQAKRDHLEKWGYTISVNKKGELYNANCKRGLNKDLTALLEQHKEMMLREELIAYTEYGQKKSWMLRSIVRPGFYVDEYLKNVKK